MITSPSICPYSRFSLELREKWHKERGVADPFKKVVEKRPMEDLVPDKPPLKPEVKIEEPKPESDGMTKQQRYRLRNKEKLAAKERERRAGK